MKRSSFSTPILLLVFNRPDYFARMIAVLRPLRPTQLFISGDGPRPGNVSDAHACTEIKKLVDEIDWPCQIHTYFRSKNLGCKKGVSTGISWFFKQVNEGIILEDDCQPDHSFFRLCAELLAKYRHNHKIWQICGANFAPQRHPETSYDFSIHPLCWGWATWRRCWQHYDVNMRDWPTQKHRVLRLFSSARSRAYWQTIFDKMFAQEIDTWDYQWIYLIWKQQGLVCIPAHNLVTNIGFDQRATHTKFSISPLAHVPVFPLEFPLTHPRKVQRNATLDNQIQQLFEEHLIQKLIRGFLQFCTRKLFT